MGGTLAFYTYTVYMQRFLVSSVGLVRETATLVSAASLFVFMLLQPAFGALSDRVGRRPLLIAFGGDARLESPRGVHFEPLQRKAHRERGQEPDDGRALARHPQAGVIRCHRIAAITPIPRQPIDFDRIRTQRTARQRLDAAAVFWFVPIDF